MSNWGGSVRCLLLLLALLFVACDGDSADRPPPPTQTPATPATTTPTPTAIPPTPTPAFAVTSIYPSAGSFIGGIPVAIEGVGFAAGVPRVRFGDRDATSVVVLSDRRLSAVAPSGLAGSTVPVSVLNASGRVGTGASFRYIGGSVGRALQIEPVGLPEVSLDRRIGTTRILLDYLVRDGFGRPLSPAQYRVRLFLDGNQLGTGMFDESVLGSDAQELELDLFLMLVLDASFSLQGSSTPRFAETLQAAENFVVRGADIWSRRPGSFDWSIVWFNELLARPDPDFTSTFRITAIPAPSAGDFTKLYGAVGAGLEVSADLRADGVASGPRSRHVVVVFTDGRDNLSGFDNLGVQEKGILSNGDPYDRFGWRSTDLTALLREIADHPAYPESLTLHTVGLGESCETTSGTCFDREALAQMAQVGLGQQLDALDDVGGLFEEVAREFETLKSDGAIMALRPGTYAFDLVVERLDNSAVGELRFLFVVRDSGAEFLSFQ